MALDRRIFAQVDDAHGATTEFPDDLIAAQRVRNGGPIADDHGAACTGWVGSDRVGGRAGLAGRVCRFVFLLNRTTAWTTGEGLGQRVGMTNPGERQPDGRADQAAGDQPVIERLLGSPEHRNAMRLIRASGHEDDQEERGGKQNRTEKGLALAVVVQVLPGPGRGEPDHQQADPVGDQSHGLRGVHA